MARRAVENNHFRHYIDGKGVLVFLCRTDPCKPRKMRNFSSFWDHMMSVHQLDLPPELLDQGRPRLCSKSDHRPPRSTHAGPGSTSSPPRPSCENESAWDRLRGTVRKRWKQCKGRKKTNIRKVYQILTAQPSLGPKKPILVKLMKANAVFDSWDDLADAELWATIENLLLSCKSTVQVSEWCTKVQLQDVESPEDRKLGQLLSDLKSVWAIFPRSGLDEEIASDLGLVQTRDNIIQDALLYVEHKKSMQEWRSGVKCFDFPAGLEDYKKWKLTRKPKSIHQMAANCVKHYMQNEGLSRARAEDKAGIHEHWTDTSSAEDYIPDANTWGKKKLAVEEESGGDEDSKEDQKAGSDEEREERPAGDENQDSQECAGYKESGGDEEIGGDSVIPEGNESGGMEEFCGEQEIGGEQQPDGDSDIGQEQDRSTQGESEGDHKIGGKEGAAGDDRIASEEFGGEDGYVPDSEQDATPVKYLAPIPLSARDPLTNWVVHCSPLTKARLDLIASVDGRVWPATKQQLREQRSKKRHDIQAPVGSVEVLYSDVTTHQNEVTSAALEGPTSIGAAEAPSQEPIASERLHSAILGKGGRSKLHLRRPV